MMFKTRISYDYLRLLLGEPNTSMHYSPNRYEKLWREDGFHIKSLISANRTVVHEVRIYYNSLQEPTIKEIALAILGDQYMAAEKASQEGNYFTAICAIDLNFTCVYTILDENISYTS